MQIYSGSARMCLRPLYMLFLFSCLDYKYKALIQVKESCLKVLSVLELSKLVHIAVPLPLYL